MTEQHNEALRLASLMELSGAFSSEPSQTAGMNIAQRILHVGGRDNAAGYVEFGSIQAVEALVKQVLRDLPAPQPVAREPLREIDILQALQSITNEAPQRLPAGWIKFTRAIEAAHGIKGGQHGTGT